MNRHPPSALRGAILCIACVGAVTSPAVAGSVFSQAQTLSSAAAPVEQSFTPSAAQAGAVDVIVQDVRFPVPLATLRVAVTQGTTVLQSAGANVGAPNPATLTFTAVAGTAYQIRVVGRPDATIGSGAALVTVAQHGAPANTYATFPAAFSLPLAVGATGQLPDQTLHFPAAGAYTATLTDYALPAPIMTPAAGFLGAALFSGATQVATISGGAPTTVTIPAAGDYTLRIIAASTSGDGLFGLRIVDAATPATIVYPAAGSSGVTAIGQVEGPAIVASPAAGSVTLSVTDLNFPTTLATLGAVLTGADGQPIARECATPCGPADAPTGMAPAGSLLLWRAARASSATPNSTGSYLLSVTAAAGTLYTDVADATSAAAGALTSAFSFPFTAAAAGTYTVTVSDLQAPAALAGLQFGVFQNGLPVSLGALGTPGTVTVNLAAGPASVNVVASGTTSSQGAGVFGVQVQRAGSPPTTLVSLAQAVGRFTSTRSFDVSSTGAGPYALTLTDARWPYGFNTLEVFITQGAQILGKIYGGGTIPLTLSAGTYQLTFSAVPDTTERAGLYGLDVASVAAPTVTLSAAPTMVKPGESVALSWSTSAATACTASGGWSGPQPLSGAGVTEGPLSVTTTYTLSCSGIGGSASASATVSVATSSGGGGSVDPLALVALLALVARRRRRPADSVALR